MYSCRPARDPFRTKWKHKINSNKTDQRKRLISCYRSCIHVYSWRPAIIVAFDFRTKCAVTDRIETAYIVDDLQLLLFEPNVTCMQGLEIHAYI